MKEIVIRMSEQEYAYMIHKSHIMGDEELYTRHGILTRAFERRTELPKGHGELITKGQAVALVQFYQQNPQHFSFDNLIDDIDKEMPVIEGDTE